MANTQVPSFAPDAAVGTSFGFASAAVAVPGTPASDSILRVCNMGPYHIAVKLGTTSAVSVTQSSGLIIPAGQVAFLTLGSNTYLAGVACGGPGSTSTANLTSGN